MMGTNPTRVRYDDLAYTDDCFYIYESKRFTGVAIEDDDCGNILSEITFVDGRQHGSARDYYPSGQLMGETLYREGLKHGREREWFVDGQLQHEREFEFDVFMFGRTWDDSGLLVEEYSRPENDPLYRLVSQWRRIDGGATPDDSGDLE